MTQRGRARCHGLIDELIKERVMWRHSLVAAVVLSAAMVPAQAQGIGGLVRKKIDEQTKPQPDAQTTAAASKDNWSFEYTPGTMAAFKRGLELEIRLRDDYRRQVAALKTPEQYDACVAEFAATPEAMKIQEEYSARLGKITGADDIQKASEWLDQKMKAGVGKRCGEDPGPLRARQQEFFEKAAQAGAIEFAKGSSRPPSRHDDDDLVVPWPENETLCAINDAADEGDSVYTNCTAAVPSPALVRMARPALSSDTLSTEEKKEEYARLKEMIEAFCSLPKEKREEAQKAGIKVPGNGENIFWVFSRGFAIWVGDDCDHLKKLFKLVT